MSDSGFSFNDWGIPDPTDLSWSDPLNYYSGSYTPFDSSSSGLNLPIADIGQLANMAFRGFNNELPYQPPGTMPSPSGTSPSALPSSSSDYGITPAPAPASGTGFDWSNLSNFSTPYPYALGLGGLLIASSMMRR